MFQGGNLRETTAAFTQSTISMLRDAGENILSACEYNSSWVVLAALYHPYCRLPN